MPATAGLAATIAVLLESPSLVRCGVVVMAGAGGIILEGMVGS